MQKVILIYYKTKEDKLSLKADFASYKTPADSAITHFRKHHSQLLRKRKLKVRDCVPSGCKLAVFLAPDDFDDDDFGMLCTVVALKGDYTIAQVNITPRTFNLLINNNKREELWERLVTLTTLHAAVFGTHADTLWTPAFDDCEEFVDNAKLEREIAKVKEAITFDFIV